MFPHLQEPEESLQSKGRKRPARGRGRGSQAPAKRGKKSDNSLIHSMFMNKDDDDDDDDTSNRLKNTQPRVSEVPFSFDICLHCFKLM